MKERPILFRTPMVQAVLDGRKTMTRRVVNQQPDYTPNDCWSFYFKGVPPGYDGPKKYDGWKVNYTPTVPEYAVFQMDQIVHGCPYGKVGDRLWVRETHIMDPPNDGTWNYGAFGSLDLERENIHAIPPRFRKPEHVIYRASNPDFDTLWRPSIFMPRWASRITLEITGVRVERLQEISDSDAFDEGFEPEPIAQRIEGYLARSWFRKLWNDLNAKRGFGWDVNPWVWCIEFKRV